MITDERLTHIIKVARTAQRLAECLRPNDKEFAEDMFLLGLVHDVGYEFSEGGKFHSKIGGEILRRNAYRYADAVTKHSYLTDGELPDELYLLYCADMMVDTKGIECSLQERVNDIKKRYGADSVPYQDSLKKIEKLKSDARYRAISKVRAE